MDRILFDTHAFTCISVDPTVVDSPQARGGDGLKESGVWAEGGGGGEGREARLSAVGLPSRSCPSDHVPIGVVLQVVES